MTTLFAIFTFFSACSKPLSVSSSENFAQTGNNNISKMEISANTNSPIEYLISTYDNTEFAEEIKKHKETLKLLSEKKVFSLIDAKLKLALIQKHLDYFKTKSDYELLSTANGDLFQENKNDCVFIVYDKINQRVSILVYNETTNKYFELFRELSVENGLKTANCNYSSFGTVDYKLADDIVYQVDDLIKKPESYFMSSQCKIANLSKDEDFVLAKGCISKKVSISNLSNLLCIPTSSVYNNWECLRFDKLTNTFVIIYGQAFAD